MGSAAGNNAKPGVETVTVLKWPHRIQRVGTAREIGSLPTRDAQEAAGPTRVKRRSA